MPAHLTLALLLLTACGTTEPDPAEEGRLDPDAWGPYAPGRTTLRFTDARGEAMVVDVWYPATVPRDALPTPYPDVPIALRAVSGAPPVTTGAPYPLIAFSHGFGGVRYQSAFLTEHLASHGYVIVSADHPGSILLDMERSSVTALRRPVDVMSAVDHALALAAAGDPLLGGMIVDGGYSVIGHSAGAITAQALAGGAHDLAYARTFCEDNSLSGCSFFDDLDEDSIGGLQPSDPRAERAILMSPGAWYMFGEHGIGLRELPPTLVLTGDVDSVLDYETEARPVYEALGEPRWLGTLHDAGHYAAFSDMCLLLSFFGDCPGPEAGFLDAATGQAVVRRVVTAWLGRHHKGDARYDVDLDPAALSGLPALTWESPVAP